jgi:hypothetical protein
LGTEDGRQVTKKWDMEQRAGDKEQRSETWNRRWETRNRDVKQVTKGGKQGKETWDTEQRMGDKEHTLETGEKDVRQRTGKGDRGNGWQGRKHGSIPIKTNFRVRSANA